MKTRSQPTFRSTLRRWLPYLAVVAICGLALFPFLRTPSLPAGTDAELHIFRLAELSRLVRSGIIYPRWAPNFYFGYGYPIFNYYAPLSYYVALAFDLLPAISPVGAVKAVFAGSLLLSGLAMFAFVRSLWGDPAGYAAAALYVYAPYVQYVDPHARGVLAETASLALLPLGLWALQRLHQRPSGRHLLLAVLAIAAALLTHNLMALVFGAFFAGWLLWRLLAGTKASRPLLAAFLLGIALTAFFWVPVGLERTAVNLETLVGEEGSHFAYTSHFLSLAELAAPSLRLDWGASAPAYRFNLGVAQWLTAALGLGLLALEGWRAPKKGGAPLWRHPAFFFALAGLGLIFTMVPASTFLWRAAPLLPFLQFPWRLLGPAAAVLAVLGGFAVYRLPTYLPRLSRPDLPVIALTLLLAAPLSQVPPWEPFGPTSVAAVAQEENRGRWLGTTSTADFVPATVDTIPRPEEQLLADLLAGRTPNRVNETSLPAGTTLEQRSINLLHWQYAINAPEPFLLRLYLFDFPGWRVTIDGEPVDTEIGRPEGFIVAPVPAGTHLVDVRFSSTLPRTAGWLITGLALAVTLGLAWRWPPAQRSEPHLPARKPADSARPAALTALLLTALILLLPAGWLHDHSRGFTAEPAAQAESADFDRQIRLIGSEISPQRPRTGRDLTVTLYWKAQTEPKINFQSFVHVLAPDGRLVAQADKLNPGEFPTRRWPLDKYVRDVYKITLPADLSPGSYQVAVGLWVQTEGYRLPVLDSAGQQVGDSHVVGEIEVR